MKNLHLIGLSALLSVVVACASQPEPPDGSESTGASSITAASACIAGGGTCVGLAPSSCAGGSWAALSCGGGVGVGCCLPASPVTPDAGPAPAPAPAPAPGCTPLPGPTGSGVGIANPAAVYCVALGYQLVSEVSGTDCAFPDGTSCNAWAFYRGECGQAHSFCNLHGGSVANATEDMGTWTATYALCTLPSGEQCQDAAFARTCTCE